MSLLAVCFLQQGVRKTISTSDIVSKYYVRKTAVSFHFVVRPIIRHELVVRPCTFAKVGSRLWTHMLWCVARLNDVFGPYSYMYNYVCMYV